MSPGLTLSRFVPAIGDLSPWPKGKAVLGLAMWELPVAMGGSAWVPKSATPPPPVVALTALGKVGGCGVKAGGGGDV